MKKLILIGWLGLITVHAKATTIDDLKIKCSGRLKIEEVIKATYSPAVPPHGRFPGLDASESIQTKASLISMTGEGCSLLTTKYKIDLSKALNLHIGVNHAISQIHAETLAKSLIGTGASFDVVQYFDYVTEKKYLPLFPQVVSEDIYLEGKTDQGGDWASVNLTINVADIYGTKPVETWNESEKVALAKKLFWAMGDLSTKYDLNDFANLFLSLDLQTPAGKKAVFQMLWKKFNETAVGGFTHFFHFEVGGPGAFVGHPFAKKLNGLANEIATEQEKEQLVFQFPTLLVPGGYSIAPCLNLTPENLHHIMTQWQQMYPTFLVSHASDIQRILKQIAVDQNKEWTGQCVANLQINGNKEFAQEILNGFLN